MQPFPSLGAIYAMLIAIGLLVCVIAGVIH